MKEENRGRLTKEAKKKKDTRMTGKILVLCFICLPSLLKAQTPDVVIYPRPREDTKLAVADFVARTSDTSEVRAALRIFDRVLWDDLEFSAFFEMPSKSFYPLKPLRSPTDVRFDNWKIPTLDVDFLIFGNLQVDSGLAVVEAYLYDVRTREQVLGKRYNISDEALIQRVAHEFADQVVSSCLLEPVAAWLVRRSLIVLSKVKARRSM